jgi:hypothetical protein
MIIINPVMQHSSVLRVGLQENFETFVCQNSRVNIAVLSPLITIKYTQQCFKCFRRLESLITYVSSNVIFLIDYQIEILNIAALGEIINEHVCAR